MPKRHHQIVIGMLAVGALAAVAYYLEKKRDAAIAGGDLPASIDTALNGSFPGIGLIPLFANPTIAQQVRAKGVGV